jgi:hypothetical protein
VAAVVTYHGETGLLDDGLDHGADLGDAHARTHLLDGGVQAILRHLAEAAQGVVWPTMNMAEVSPW